MADGFHLLRPLWLLALPVAAALWIVLRRMSRGHEAWRGVIDPHLLEALLVRRERRGRPGPVEVLGVAWVVAVLALAGPSWRREPAPFAQETAALVIVMKVTPAMTARDVQPSRLERAAQKVADLLERRPDADCALIAYAGSEHRVMPLTPDGELIASFARSLAPELMPAPEGDACAAALALANAELRRNRRSGSIVLLADGVSPEQLAEIEASDSVPVHALGAAASPELALAGAPPPDFDSLRRVARATGGSFTRISPDASDVDELAGRVERRFGRVGDDEGAARREDDGYWLVPLLVLAVLVWARRGFVIGVPGSAA